MTEDPSISAFRRQLHGCRVIPSKVRISILEKLQVIRYKEELVDLYDLIGPYLDEERRVNERERLIIHLNVEHLTKMATCLADSIDEIVKARKL
jgi:hypothetical protein